MTMTLAMLDEVYTFHDRVLDELLAAMVKHPAEEGTLSDAEWLAIMVEEVGECAKALQEEPDEALVMELSHVAAMALRWYLSIPRGRVRPPWSETKEVA